MILLVYRKNGTISHIYENAIDAATLSSRIIDFNNKHEEQVSAVSCDEIAEWLYFQRKANIKDFKQQLEDIEDKIDSLSSDCNWISELVKEASNEHK